MWCVLPGTRKDSTSPRALTVRAEYSISCGCNHCSHPLTPFPTSADHSVCLYERRYGDLDSVTSHRPILDLPCMQRWRRIDVLLTWWVTTNQVHPPTHSSSRSSSSSHPTLNPSILRWCTLLGSFFDQVTNSHAICCLSCSTPGR
jgi:hypothetical protein